MQIPPKYSLSPKSIYYLTQIEAAKAVFETVKIPEKVVENLTRRSLLKSALFSAKIEGNTLVLEEAEDLYAIDPKVKERIEIENILSAFSFLQGKDKHIEINSQFILKLHSFVMKNLLSDVELGKFRKVPSAIFNQAGIAVYVTPPPALVPQLIEQLVVFINEQSDMLIPIKAFLAHLLFEKIHPFGDGNGRVGRLLVQAMLAKGNYHFSYLLSLEELLNAKKSEYYDLLDRNDPSLFLEFMLETMFEKLEILKTEVIQTDSYTKEDTLLPRRREILEIIKDHGEVSLDTIQRRFFRVPARTLRYELNALEKEGFIMKIGSTRGALYKIRGSP